ncbi:MAG: FkbM family methyltransferase [Anaerolineales bacterium]|nr:FkbM family methyltransferase [Anaerolineales bacterium]
MTLLLRKITARLNYQRIRAQTALYILRTALPYWRVVRDDGLNYRFKHSRFSPPEIKTLSEDDQWKLLEIGDFRFYWPAEYAIRGLRGVYREVFTPADSNPHAYEARHVTFKANDWVIDAGAGEGYFTHYALRRGANVLMIEPVPRLAEALTHTFENEMKAGRVVLLQGGLANREGEIEMTIPRDSLFAAYTESFSGAEAVNIENIDLAVVPVYTLDGIARRGLIPKIDFLKMDIEGAEVAAFQGAREMLRAQKPKLSVAVYHDFDNARLIRSLAVQVVPAYYVSFRGVFMKPGFGHPRPYMLHASI